MTVREALPTMTVRGHSSDCHAEPPHRHAERSEESKVPLLGLLHFSTTRPVCKDLDSSACAPQNDRGGGQSPQ